LYYRENPWLLHICLSERPNEVRGKENITQIQLSELTGIPRRHISDMENGRRPIGKHNALKIADALNTNYRVFL